MDIPSFTTLKTGGSAVISCGNNDRTLSTSNRNRQSLSSDRAGDVGVDNGVLAASVGGTTGICNGGRTGGEEDCSVTTSTPGRQGQVSVGSYTTYSTLRLHVCAHATLI